MQPTCKRGLTVPAWVIDLANATPNRRFIITKTTLTFVASLLSTGCGKASTEALCEDSCAKGEAYAARCADELGRTANPGGTECTADCVDGGENADAAGCTDEYRALLNCYKNVNVDTLECSLDVLLSICSVEQTAVSTCMSESGGWDTGDWDTGR